MDEESKAILLKLSSRMTDLGIRVCQLEEASLEKELEKLDLPDEHMSQGPVTT